MARIQTYENSQGVTAGSVVKHPVQDDISNAIAGFGKTVNSVGMAILAEDDVNQKKAKARAESMDNLRLQSAIMDHEDRVKAYAESQAPNFTGEGTDGQGFTKAVSDFATKDADAAIRGNFSNRLDADELPFKFRNATRPVLSSVGTTEMQTGLKYQSSVSDKVVSGLSTKIALNPDNYDDAASEWVNFAATTNMERPELQARMAEVGLAKLQRARLEAYAGLHPEEFKKAAVGAFAGTPSADSSPTEQAIVHAATDAGVDPATMLAMGHVESGLNPDAVSKTSSATGVLQIIDDPATLNELGITAEQRADPVISAKVASAFIARKTEVMKAKNIPVTPGKQYMFWQMGPGVALATMQADPRTPMSDIVNSVLSKKSPEYRAKFMAGNPGFYGPNMTAGQVVNTFERKMDEATTKSTAKITETNASTDGQAHSFFEKLFPGGAPLLGAKDLGEVYVMSAKKSAELSREQQDLNLGSGIAVGAIRPDPRDDHAVKALGEYIVKNNLTKGLVEGDDDAHTLAARITDNAGVVPEPFVNAYSASINGGDVKSKYKTYAVLADLQARNPGAFDATKFSADDRSRANEYVALTTVSNLSPDDAIKRIDFYRSPEGKKQADAQKAGLQTTKTAEVKELSDVDVLKHFDAPWTISRPTDAEGKFIAAATDAYKEQYTYYREQGRSADDAKSMALASLDKNWGASRVSDSGKGANTQTFMPYPPEKSYRATDVGHEWVSDQAKNQAAAFVADRYPKMTASYTPSNRSGRAGNPDVTAAGADGIKSAVGVKLIADIRTAQEARSNQPRGYMLMVRLPDGSVDIDPTRFYPDQAQADLEAAERFRTNNKRTLPTNRSGRAGDPSRL